ncbi:MAG: radical SAM protein [Clostridia bacterium]|nr:radical SAM protein [Clostridia bacterium]
MPNKAFLEITNACNLSCSFCHGTKRPIRYISRDEFEKAAAELRSFADYLYFHLMGEPLLHPDLAVFLAIAKQLAFRVILTTNGTLLPQKTDILLNAPALHKISISLHSFEANNSRYGIDEYLTGCFRFCEQAAEQGKIAVMRLWNLGGAQAENQYILHRMHEYFDTQDSDGWKTIYSGYKIREKIFLEWGEKFDWPDTEAAPVSSSHFCYGLRDQIGVLSDGTVVPCCLDADGAVPLGNLFAASLAEILNSPRAVALRKAFETRQITEPLCRRCGYAGMKQYRK